MKGPPLTDVNSLSVIVTGGEDHIDCPTERGGLGCVCEAGGEGWVEKAPHGNVASHPATHQHIKDEGTK